MIFFFSGFVLSHQIFFFIFVRYKCRKNYKKIDEDISDNAMDYDTAIENCIYKIDSLETRTQILEALVEKQSEQNNKHEVTIYLKTK